MTFHFTDSESKIGQNITMYDSDGISYFVNKEEVILSGDLLIDANATYHEGEPAVGF